jgi:hypothetical protein
VCFSTIDAAMTQAMKNQRPVADAPPVAFHPATRAMKTTAVTTILPTGPKVRSVPRHREVCTGSSGMPT